MKRDASGNLPRFVDRWTVEYVRVYPHPIERVWRAISEPTEISAWFWAAKIDLRVGGAFRFGPDDSEMSGVFETIDPPRVIRFKGPSPVANPEGFFQFTLDSLAAGTQVSFVQHFTPGIVLKPEWGADPDTHPFAAVNPWRAGTLSGWHLALAAPGHALFGAISFVKS